MANQTSLRGVVRVDISAGKSKQLVPRLSSASIPGTKSGDLGSGGGRRILGCLVGSAHVSELVVDAVGDDVGVQGLLLAPVHQRVDGLEGRLGIGATVKPGFEFDGGNAQAKVERRVGRGHEAAK